MLIRTVEEIKEYFHINGEAFSFERIAPDLRWAEENYIKKFLGNAMYTELNTAYNSETEEDYTEALQALNKYCQLAEVYFAFAKALPMLAIQVSDSGIHVVSMDTQKQAWQHQADDLQEEYLYQKAYESIDMLLAFLEENKVTYTTWAGDPIAYTVNKQFFITTTGQFNDYVNIGNSRRTFTALYPVMRKIEEFKLEPALGTPFYEELKTEIKTGSLSEDTQKLMRFIVPVLANYTMADAIASLPLVIKDNSITVSGYKAISDNNREKALAPNNLLAAKAEACERDGHAYLTMLKKYLNENASSSKYALYFSNSNVYTDPSTATSRNKNSPNNNFYRVR